MSPQEIVPGVARMAISIANVYFVGAPGSAWFLVDSGTPEKSKNVIKAATERYGEDSRPEFIFLTHGHFDHSGSAYELAEHWQVPIYAHELEFPYLTGVSPYPPKDPTVGGAMAFLSRFFPVQSTRLQPHLRALPPEGEVPGHPEWRWILTPGHAPGQVSLFNEKLSVLLAGDAFATADLDSPLGLLTQQRRVSRPPSPFTYDWQAARSSVKKLAKLEPMCVGCGHGHPMTGSVVAIELNDLAENFPMPGHGRYVPEPAQTDERGIRYVPPARPDNLPKILAAAGIAVSVAAVLLWKVKTEPDGDELD